ncbi:hypothetical protein PM082_010052 [Marasmius tenuissimus]|nr:hypothetical protein PM082_010052 [Marasmius tenuissimus]
MRYSSLQPVKTLQIQYNPCDAEQTPLFRTITNTCVKVREPVESYYYHAHAFLGVAGSGHDTA